MPSQNPGGEQQLKFLIAGVTLETNERKLNVEWGERRISVEDLGNFGIVPRDDHFTAGLAESSDGSSQEQAQKVSGGVSEKIPFLSMDIS